MIWRPKMDVKICVSFWLLAVSPALVTAEEVGSILEQIKKERASAVTVPEPPTISVPNAVHTTTAPSAQHPQPLPQAAYVAPQPARPTVKVWRPKDKLPKDVIGDGVAGRFAVEGHYEGRLCLVPIEDRANPFARHFVVVNRSLNLPDFHVLPIPERQLVEIPEASPLIFEHRGIMGYYYVRAQD